MGREKRSSKTESKDAGISRIKQGRLGDSAHVHQKVHLTFFLLTNLLHGMGTGNWRFDSISSSRM